LDIFTKIEHSKDAILLLCKEDTYEGGDHREIMVLPRQFPQEHSVNHFVMLNSAKHLAEPWPGWTGLDPSTPPGSALDDKEGGRLGPSNIEGLEP